MNRLAGRAIALGIMCSLVTNHISAVAPQDEKVGRLKAEWRLVKKGINATIKGLKGRTLTQDERASRISLAKQVGILLGLIAVASGVYVIGKKIRAKRLLKEKIEIEKQWHAPTVKGTEPQKAFFQAIVDKNIEKVNELLAQGVNPDTMRVTVVEEMGYIREYPLLHWVIYNQNTLNIPPITMQTLITKSNLETKGYYGMTPLHVAVLMKHTDIVQALLDARASLDAKDHGGRTPLGLAQDHNQQSPGEYSEIIQLLQTAEQKKRKIGLEKIEKTKTEEEKKEEKQLAEPTKVEAPLTVPEELFEAIKKGNKQQINNLLAQDVNPDTILIDFIPPDKKEVKLPLLHWVIWNLDKLDTPLVTMKDLIAKANLEIRDPLSLETPLHSAVAVQHIGVVQALIEARAPLTATDYKGRTPLGLAQEYNKRPGKDYSEMIQILQAAEQRAAQK